MTIASVYKPSRSKKSVIPYGGEIGDRCKKNGATDKAAADRLAREFANRHHRLGAARNRLETRQ